MKNIAALLAPGGRVVHVETATTSRYCYSAISPSWFFDFAVVNRFADCKVYMGSAGDWRRLRNGPWAMLGFDHNHSERPNAFTCDLGGELGVQVILMEKGVVSTHDRMPIQAHYRSDAHWRDFLDGFAPLRESKRPFHLGRGGNGEPIATLENAWCNCGWWE